MSTPPTITCSICIANYNGIKLLPDCIQSLLDQQPPLALEIIIHDDASTDGSAKWIRAQYPGIKLIASNENVGFCVANNRMADVAQGRYILLLNNDAALLPDALSTLIQASEIGLPSAILTLPQYDWDSGELVDRGCLLDPFYNPVPNLDPERRNVAYAIGACMFMTRATWKELGGFPSWMKSMAEDMFLCCLARLSGRPVVALSNSGYRHRQGASFGGNRAGKSGLSSTYRRRMLSECNKTATLVICTPTPLVWPLLMVHLLLLCVEGSVMAAVKRDSLPWHTIYAEVMRHTYKELPSWIKRRRLVHESRKSALAYFTGFTLFPQKLRLLIRHGLPQLR